MRERFNLACRTRRDAGHKIRVGSSFRVSMFFPEDPNKLGSAGGGVALGKDPIMAAPIVSMVTNARTHPLR